MFSYLAACCVHAVICDYNFCFIMIFLCHRAPAQVPRLVLPQEIFVSIGKSIGGEVNRDLKFLQDVSCGGNLKQFVVVGLNCVFFVIMFPSLLIANQTTVLVSSTI